MGGGGGRVNTRWKKYKLHLGEWDNTEDNEKRDKILEMTKKKKKRQKWQGSRIINADIKKTKASRLKRD